jgi:Superinfection immunity protein
MWTSEIIAILLLVIAAVIAIFLADSNLITRFTEVFNIVAILAILLIVYFVPSIVASRRNHRNLLAIQVLNLFAGWTALGWLAALVWACTNNAENQMQA